MKKKIVTKERNLISKFEKSKNSELLTIQGGNEPEKTVSMNYLTHCSATDCDCTEHDCDY